MAQNREPLRSTDNVMRSGAAAGSSGGAQKDLTKVIYSFSLKLIINIVHYFSLTNTVQYFSSTNIVQYLSQVMRFIYLS